MQWRDRELGERCAARLPPVCRVLLGSLRVVPMDDGRKQGHAPGAMHGEYYASRVRVGGWVGELWGEGGWVGGWFSSGRPSARQAKFSEEWVTPRHLHTPPRDGLSSRRCRDAPRCSAADSPGPGPCPPSPRRAVCRTSVHDCVRPCGKRARLPVWCLPGSVRLHGHFCALRLRDNPHACPPRPPRPSAEGARLPMAAPTRVAPAAARGPAQRPSQAAARPGK